MQPRGLLVDEDGYATLTFHRVYRHRIEHVWEAIATPEGLRGWLLCSFAAIDGRVGGRIDLVSGAAAYRSTGAILAWDPPSRLEYEWNVEPVPEMPAGERAIFRFDLASFDDGKATRLDVTYRRITTRTAASGPAGYPVYLTDSSPISNRPPTSDTVASPRISA